MRRIATRTAKGVARLAVATVVGGFITLLTIHILQARALHKAPKYGRDDDVADALAHRVMELWTEDFFKEEK